jgi:hypothetical protein
MIYPQKNIALQCFSMTISFVKQYPHNANAQKKNFGGLRFEKKRAIVKYLCEFLLFDSSTFGAWLQKIILEAL